MTHEEADLAAHARDIAAQLELADAESDVFYPHGNNQATALIEAGLRTYAEKHNVGETKFVVGGWVFCEFILQQIKEVDGERVREVSDGLCSHSGDLTDRCRPMTLAIKRVSDTFKWYSDRFHREGSSGLNYPDIHRWLVEQWMLACSHVEIPEALKIDMDRLTQFSSDVFEQSSIASGYGFPLLRPRR